MERPKTMFKQSSLILILSIVSACPLAAMDKTVKRIMPPQVTIPLTKPYNAVLIKKTELISSHIKITDELS